MKIKQFWRIFVIQNTYFVSVEFEVIHVDEYIDELLREERCCDVIMPRIQVKNAV